MILAILMVAVAFFVASMIRRNGAPGDVNKFWMALMFVFGLADFFIGAWVSALFCAFAFTLNYFAYKSAVAQANKINLTK